MIFKIINKKILNNSTNIHILLFSKKYFNIYTYHDI